MRVPSVVLPVAALFLWASAAPQLEQPLADQEVALKELRELRRAVEVLERRLSTLEVQVRLDRERWRERGPDYKALSTIELPDNPTKKQVREYVSQVLRASHGQRSYSESDPQIRMLAKVGPGNLDVLIDLGGHTMSGFHIVEVLKRLAGDEHKEMVIEALPFWHNLVEVVVEKGWEQDAREILIAELRSPPKFLPTDWTRAVAHLKEPATYEVLKAYLVNGWNRHLTYEAIKDLPGIQLGEVVAEVWERAKGEGGWEAASMAEAAIEHGHIDALECAVNELGLPRWVTHMHDAREVVLRHIDFYGTDAQIRRWFHANKDKLVFDPETKKFRVRGQ